MGPGLRSIPLRAGFWLKVKLKPKPVARKRSGGRLEHGHYHSFFTGTYPQGKLENTKFPKRCNTLCPTRDISQNKPINQ